MNQKCNTDKSEWIWLTNRKWPKFAPCRKLYPSRHTAHSSSPSQRGSPFILKNIIILSITKLIIIFLIQVILKKKKILPSHRNICIENHHSLVYYHFICKMCLLFQSPKLQIRYLVEIFYSGDGEVLGQFAQRR